jgi:hypothetical protein
MRSHLLPLAMVVLLSSLASAQILISPSRLPDAGVGINYYVEFNATGGSAPYKWSFRAALPGGLAVDPQSATLTGIPNSPGDYEFSVRVTDSSGQSAARTYTLHVTPGNTITIAWTRLPTVSNGGISGEIEVTNPGREAFDLTFIAVAVNEIGRATALGYQRFTFGPGKQKIPFGTTLPRGTYVVHADAVGEIARTQTIRRARLQSNPLVIP